jgi:two-component system sensor histidine kinase KdpD
MRRNFSQVGRALVRRSRGEALSVLKSLTLVAVTTIALLILDQFFALRHVTLVYLVPVVIAATKLGIGPAVIAALAGGGASAFFFYPPIYSFLVEDPQHLIELPLFVFVAIVTGHLASSLRRQADLARRRETEVHDLYAFSRRLAAAHTPGDIYTAIREHLASVIGRRTILFEAAPPGVPGAALSDEGQIPDAVKRAMEALAEAGKGSGNSSVVEEGGRVWLVRPVCGNAGDFGVLAIDLGQQKGKMADAVRERVDAVLADATATLEHLDLGRALSDARVRSETEALRDALIGSVSHQLRTPLVSILGAATVISSAPGNRGDPRLASLADILRDEVDRRQRLLAGHRLRVDIPDEMPFVYVDPVLLEQALGQIVDNAAKYSPPGSQITIGAKTESDSVVLSVRDEGIGLVGEEQTRLWERFFRGERGALSASGSGLGLWIAKAFVSANGGQIEAFSEGADRGTLVSIRLPAREPATPDLAVSGDG